LLSDFFDFVRAQPEIKFVHWAMRSHNFGFNVLRQRASMHGLIPVEIAETRCFDLATYLKRKFGDDYVPHQRLTNLIRLNYPDALDVLDPDQSRAAWERGDLSALLQSLSAKVSCIAKFYDHVCRGTLRCGSEDIGADKTQKNQHNFPTNSRLLQLAKRIKKEYGKGRSKNKIALDFTEENAREA